MISKRYTDRAGDGIEGAMAAERGVVEEVVRGSHEAEASSRLLCERNGVGRIVPCTAQKQ